MLRLPGRIVAHLMNADGGAQPAADILIGINLLVGGRYYYGNLVGLTDACGSAAIRRDELDLRFAADAAMYPMDYKVNAESCDPMIEVFILSDEQVQAAREAIATSTVTYDIDQAYQRARNIELTPAVIRLWADLPNQQDLVVHLTTSPVSDK